MINIKRIGNIFDKICSYENIKEAHKMASKDKHDYTEVVMVNKNPDYFIKRIQKMLKEGTYTITNKNYKHKVIVDNGKRRDLYKLSYYPHRIIQWAIILQIGKYLEKNFTADTYSSIKNRGLHTAAMAIRRDLDMYPEKTKYCLKIDITKYYPSIDNNILFDKLKRKFKDNKLLNLLHIIIFSMGDKGQPIGSLWSQFAGNFYLSELDHLLKEKYDVEFYYRYCDDLVILSSDKYFLHKTRATIFFVLSNLKLNMKNNYQVFNIEKRGIDFLGYRFYPNYTILRKRTLNNMITKTKKLINKPILNYSDVCTIASYVGILKYCNGYKLFCKYIKPFNNKKAKNCNQELILINLKYKPFKKDWCYKKCI